MALRHSCARTASSSWLRPFKSRGLSILGSTDKGFLDCLRPFPEGAFTCVDLRPYAVALGITARMSKYISLIPFGFQRPPEISPASEPAGGSGSLSKGGPA